MLPATAARFVIRVRSSLDAVLTSDDLATVAQLIVYFALASLVVVWGAGMYRLVDWIVRL